MNNGFDTSKRAFLSLTREEQLGMLFDMCQALSNAQAIDTRDHVVIKAEITFIKGEIAGIGRRAIDDTMTTTQKFDKLMGRRFDWGVWLRDKVLPGVISFITMGLLYLVFGGTLP